MIRKHLSFFLGLILTVVISLFHGVGMLTDKQLVIGLLIASFIIALDLLFREQPDSL